MLRIAIVVSVMVVGAGIATVAVARIRARVADIQIWSDYP